MTTTPSYEFWVSLADNGLWYASSGSTPLFCLQAASEEAAVSKAESAFQFFEAHSDGLNRPRPPEPRMVQMRRHTLQRQAA